MTDKEIAIDQISRIDRIGKDLATRVVGEFELPIRESKDEEWYQWMINCVRRANDIRRAEAPNARVTV